ncbi:uncharacterized protein DUF4353 [Mobilisporobacter senegalensis]|uniref:Uncharacterized protein DUF4353 n=1 Tax=Mobilisporobacter senegalensis TaxID=1329262 RepID=A0A3N1XP64_9FIRM|nr:carbohydrate-binding domain-containing protein [Mobilisporobacter senegalensis]ROR28469.1 uncharacterized protein DUF4353 [Mobilisporobacter senegalensis]
MKRSLKAYLAMIAIASIIFTGCSSDQNSQAETVKESESSDLSAIINTSKVEVDTEFSGNDLDVGYEDSTAAHITMNGSNGEVSGNGAVYKDGILTISKEGTYVISGTLNDGQIIVDGSESDKVQIVLNNAQINCSDHAPIYIKNADKVFITLKEGTKNTLTDGTEYVQRDENNVDGVIFSKADLTINGEGTLNITGNYKNGIVSKDDLIITNGNLNITAIKDTLNGKDCVKIKDGTFQLSAETGNGIQSKNSDDETKGYVYICGGSITVTRSREGIEGTVILIEDGDINITAEDDGLNSAIDSNDTASKDTAAGNDNGKTDIPVNREREDMAEKPPENVMRERSNGFGGAGGEFAVNENCYISITGGNIVIDASADGIDTNGSLYISGGNIFVSGPENSGNGGLDYNGTAEITGGTVVIAGSIGMAQGFSDTSSQYSLLYNLPTVSEGETEVILKDEDDKVVVSFKPSKKYQSVVISTPELKKDKTYTFTSGKQTAEIKLDQIVTSNGEQGMGRPGRNTFKPENQEQTKDK